MSLYSGNQEKKKQGSGVQILCLVFYWILNKVLTLLEMIISFVNTAYIKNTVVLWPMRTCVWKHVLDCKSCNMPVTVFLPTFPYCVFLDPFSSFSNQSTHILLHSEHSWLDQCPLPSYEPWQQEYGTSHWLVPTEGHRRGSCTGKWTEALAEWQLPRSQSA